MSSGGSGDGCAPHGLAEGESAGTTPVTRPNLETNTNSAVSLVEPVLDVDVVGNEAEQNHDLRRSTRKRQLSSAAKQNKIVQLTVDLTKCVNDNLSLLDTIYKDASSHNTIEALERSVAEVEASADLANDVFDELYMLSDNKVHSDTENLFGDYMKEVDMTRDMLREKIEKLKSESEREAEEDAEMRSMEDSLAKMQAELAEQMRIFKERCEARNNSRKALTESSQDRRPQPAVTSASATEETQSTSSSVQRTSIEQRQEPSRSHHHRIHSSPEFNPANSFSNNRAPAEISNQNDGAMEVVQQLAQSLVSTMKATKRTAFTPDVFRGDYIQFTDWEIDFDSYVEAEGLTGVEPLRHLKKFVDGEAKECISSHFTTNTTEAYNHARVQLRERFGRKGSVARAMRQKLDEWPKIHHNDGKQIRKLADYLNLVRSTMETVSELCVLNHTQENEKLAEKLPAWLKTAWARKIRDTRKRESRYPTFSEYADFINDEAELLAEPILEKTPSVEQKSNRGRERRVNSFTTAANPTPKRSCLFCEKEHLTGNCFALLAKPYDERMAFVRQRRLCFSCLKEGHRTSKCQHKMTCKTCKKPHPSALHKSLQDWRSGPPQGTDSKQRDNRETSEQKASNVEQQNSQSRDEETTSISVKATKKLNSHRYSMVLPVYVYTSTSQKQLVYAMLDTQSDACFVTEQVASQINPQSTNETVTISTLNGTSTEKIVKYTNLKIQGYRENTTTTISAYSRPDIPCEREQIPTGSSISHLDHLDAIKHQLPPPLDVPIGLLIGTDCPEALAPISSITGKPGEPFAMKTILGWTVCGGNQSHQLNCHASVLTTKSVQQSLSDPHLDEDAISQDDLRFMSIMSEEARQTEGGYYQMPLPFRNRPSMPNNRYQAERRLGSIERKFAEDEDFKREYHAFMDQLFANGHAECVPTSQATKPGEVWYIPHFAVTHPKKKKLRIVFDCSAKFRGESLNDHLLQGPEHMNSLLGILCRFRKNTVAVACDVEKMFYNFLVDDGDRDYLRFLWKGDHEETKEYRMKVHLFGATSSPAVATYGLRRLASDYEEKAPAASEFVHRNFYVDDGLVSVDSEQAAIELIKDTRALCSEGNLRLHKFVSNSKKVLESLPESERSISDSDLITFGDHDSSERTLGLIWSLDRDSFKFSSQLEDKPITKRGILSTVAQIFDPLGLLSPFTLLGKNILQEINQSNQDWDEEVSHELKGKWCDWKTQLSQLDSFEVPRCLRPPDFGEVVRTELHHFADASFSGYGSCSYIRLKNANNETHCNLVLGKARVAPVKGTVTIPRLELQAAVTATRSSATLAKELDIKVDEEFFWTDSEIVLAYLNNDVKRFHIYVANRVHEIKSKTSSSQWHHISTKENPADLVSRGATLEQLQSTKWLRGPDFLQEADIQDHIKECDHSLAPDDQEVRKVKGLATTINTTESGIADRFEKFSEWEPLVRAVANLKQMAKTKTWKKGELTAEDLRGAEELIIKQTQQLRFSEEIECLAKKEQLKRSSSILKLDPILDDNGLLRVGGRAKKALSLSEAEKHPLIIPKDSSLSRLLLAHYHRRRGHMGRTSTVAATRAAGYWIIGGSAHAKTLVHRCPICKLLRGRPQLQKMGLLPEERLAMTPPFSNVGVDLFGPFTVKERRTELKKWGVLFTCLYSRGVHIEVVDDLSTDALINAMRCLISIRGPVKTFISDNGTNFIGAANELNDLYDAMKPYLLKNRIVFKNTTPSASHQGGVWERQIRTVRAVLSGMIGRYKGRLDTATLRTSLYEVMNIVNSRPLSTENMNDVDEVIITPNHLLTMKSETAAPPGEFTDTEVYGRKRWRKTQQFAEEFWQRWKSEYLSVIRKLQKWTSKHDNIKVGDLVAVVDQGKPRCEWTVGRVEVADAGNDGLVRNVTIRLATRRMDNRGKLYDRPTVLERPVQKLVRLLQAPDKSNVD